MSGPVKRKRQDEEDLVDNGRYSELVKLLEGSSSEELASFLDKSLSQLIQAWSFYSQASSHTKMTYTTFTLVKLLKRCSGDVQLTKYGGALIRDIIDNCLRVVYRCLFSNRPALVNPALQLLTESAKYSNGAYTLSLATNLDMSLKAFPKILSATSEPTGLDMRSQFIRFYLEFLKHSSSITRKDLMHQKRIIAGWLKRVNLDPEELVLDTLELFKNQILTESDFSKSTKISFFNDWVLGNVAKLFTRSDKIASSAAEFLRILCTDSTHGLRFSDKGWYVAVSEPAEGSSVPTFAVNNKLILGVLKSLKPWEDSLQQDTCVTILESCPELVAAYTTGLAESISFNPRLSSFWVSYSNFLSRVIQLPVPPLDSSLHIPPISTVIESILPASTSQTALTKSLGHDSPFVRYVAVQITCLALRKCLVVMDAFESHGWSAAPLLQLLASRVPDPQTFIACFSKPDTQLGLKSAISVCLSLYGEIIPECFSTLTLPASLMSSWQRLAESSDNAPQTAVDGLELVQVEASLRLQMVVGSLGKWYNKAADSQYSIFTTLLRLGLNEAALEGQVSALLKSLVAPTLLFQDETIVSPVDILVGSLAAAYPGVSKSAQEGILRLLDQSVARCMQSPYKYVDAFASVKQDSEVVSPLVVTVLEQWKFAKDDDKHSVERWICRFLRDLCICGESWHSVRRLVEKLVAAPGFSNFGYLLDFEDGKHTKWRDAFELDEFFDFVISSESSEVRGRSDLRSKVVGPLELSALKFRSLVDRSVAIHLFRSIPASHLEIAIKPAYFESLLTHPAAATLLAELGHAYKATPNPVKSSLKLDDLRAAVKSLVTKSSTLDSAMWLFDASDTEEMLLCNLTLVVPAVTRLHELQAPLKVSSLLAVTKGSGLAEEVVALQAYISDVKPIVDSESDLEALLRKLLGSGSSQLTSLAASIIRSTGQLPVSIQDLTTGLSGQHLVQICSVIVQSSDCDDELLSAASEAAIETLASTPLESVALLSKTMARLSEEQIRPLYEFFRSTSGSVALSQPVMECAGALYSTQKNAAVSSLRPWFQKCVLWLTKRFSEDPAVSPSLASIVDSFVESLAPVAWSLIAKKSLNSLIESALKWIENAEACRLVGALVFSGEPRSLEYNKHLQMLVNSRIEVTDATALIIWKLFKCDPKGLSNLRLQDSVLSLCQGLNRPADFLLLDILQQIEASTEKSWVRRVVSWIIKSSKTTVDDYDRSPTAVQTKHGFEISIDIDLVKDTVRGFDPEAHFSTTLSGSFTASFEATEKYRSKYCARELYNPEFVLLSLVNSPDLFQDSGMIDVKQIVECYGLSLAICCLSENTVSEWSSPACTIIAAIANFLASPDLKLSYREKTSMLVLTSKLLNLLSDPEVKIRQCTCVLLALVVPVLNNPGHFLHEKAVDFMMSGPTLYPNELALFKAISVTTSDTAVREVQWLMDALTCGLAVRSDVSLYMQRGIFEWALSVHETLPAIDVKGLVMKSQELSGGTMALVTRNAGLSWISQQISESEDRGLAKLGVRFVATADREKLNAWTDHSVKEFLQGLASETSAS